MKNHKEIYEALLAGETLVYKDGLRLSLNNNGNQCKAGYETACDPFAFHTPADWSILDTTVGLMEALAALGEGKQVRRKGYSDWCMAAPSGLVQWCVSGSPVKLDVEWATARFIVRANP